MSQTLALGADAAPAKRAPDIAIFSAPKAFKGHIGVIQRNAVRSWLALGDRAEVVLLGRDEGVAEIAEEFGIRHIPDIKCNQYGTPLLNSMIEIAEANTTAPHLCMINGDIILTSDFFRFVDALPDLPKGLYIGLRSDLDVFDPLDFDDENWEEELLNRVHREGKFRGGGDDSFNGTDYYIFPRGLYKDVPPFAIGRFFWDSWLIADPWRRGYKVVDASADILAVHQNHNYGHVKSSNVVDMYRYWENPELKENYRLARGFLNNMGPREAPFRYSQDGIVKKPGRSMLKSQVYNFWYYYPIMLRGSWLFRKTPVGRSFNHLFPFDAAAGRHAFSARGVTDIVAYKLVRPVWQALVPRPLRAGAHAAVDWVRNPRLPGKAREEHFSADAMMVDGVDMRAAFAPAHKAFGEIARPRDRALLPAYATQTADESYSYGYFKARRHWRDADILIEHIVLARKDVPKIEPDALRAIKRHLTEVFRDENFSVLTRTPGEKRPVQNPTAWPELDERIAMATERTSGVTAVLNVWKRGPDLLRRQIHGLLKQTIPLDEIWVCAFGLDDADVYKNVVDEFPGENIHFFQTSKNFKYHGRFQLALQSESEFVAFIDDDIMIGADFLRRCRDVMEMSPDAGDVGVYGWRRLPGPDEHGRLARYVNGEFLEHLPPDRKTVDQAEVDLLCGFHFVRQKHIRYMFRETPWTQTTGEDFQLAFALRKYAGLKSYVVPIDPRDPNTWGLSQDWLDIRHNATTVGDADAVRDALYWKLLNRGFPAAWMREAPAKGERRVLAAFSTAAEAKAVRAEIDKCLPAKDGQDVNVLALYCGGDAGQTPAAVKAFGIDPIAQPKRKMDWLNLEVAGDEARPTAGLRAIDAISAFGALVDALKPELFVVPKQDLSVVTAAQLACDGTGTSLSLV
ncbi:MAG: glycosyltransferase family 2 protein [Hyphomonadaceae bacterium]